VIPFSCIQRTKNITEVTCGKNTYKQSKETGNSGKFMVCLCLIGFEYKVEFKGKYNKLYAVEHTHPENRRLKIGAYHHVNHSERVAYLHKDLRESGKENNCSENHNPLADFCIFLIAEGMSQTAYERYTR